MNQILIGEKIAVARKGKNLSQAQLADMLFISPQAVSKWERGESCPDVIMLIKLAEIFEKDLNYFQYDADIETEQESNKSNEKRKFDMSKSEWKNVDFSDIDNFGEKFNYSNIEKCIFINSDLEGVIFKANNIEHSDFSNAKLSGSTWKGVNIDSNIFDGADLSRVVFSGCNFDHTNSFVGAMFDDTEIQSSNLHRVKFESDMTNCSFINNEMKKTEFIGVTFTNCFFKGSSFKKSVFQNCKADKTSLAFLKSCKADVTNIEIIE